MQGHFKHIYCVQTSLNYLYGVQKEGFHNSPTVNLVCNLKFGIVTLNRPHKTSAILCRLGCSRQGIVDLSMNLNFNDIVCEFILSQFLSDRLIFILYSATPFST